MRWGKKSPSFTSWIPKGRAVQPTSAAYDYFEGGVLEQSSNSHSDFDMAAAHREGSGRADVRARNGDSRAGTVFSLLWMPHAT